MGIITLNCNGKPYEQVKINQKGISFEISSSSFKVIAKGSQLVIPISCNTNFSCSCNTPWLEVSSDTDGISVQIQRNYEMKERKGIIEIKIGEIVNHIEIYQDASIWYESFELVDVDGGTFFMGAQKNDSNEINFDAAAYATESPVHRVTLRNYSIGKFEVTQEQWEAAMGKNPSSNIGSSLPVENVTWEEVQTFINILNQASGLNYRLPTEAEWEFAARGGVKSNGYLFSGSPVIGACAWYYSNSGSTTHNVGTKAPNELGIYDLSGNVREWCNDWFDPYSSNNTDNPIGADTGTTKVNRGGSWMTPYANCRNSYRNTDYPDESSQDLGFRLVLIKE